MSREIKLLNTISIQQIADSIKTHGLGVINSQINAVYKFILKKFNVFSQFLYDDLIQSPLIRELRFYKDKKKHLGRYPYERAEELAREIKRLGSFDDGKTYLDKFRQLITQVGNALGFVRLIRSAAISVCSKNIEYLPHIDENVGFENMVKEAQFSENAALVAREFDGTIQSWRSNFTDKTDYMALLSNMFDGKLNKSQNKHLEYFYLIIPALTLNYVETMLVVKDNLNKKNSGEIYVSDDGFPLGLAYFLQVLDLNRKFDSLHWFNELKQKFEGDVKKMQRELDALNSSSSKSKKPNEDNNMQTQISFRRVNMLSDEFEVFGYAFNASRILFRQNDDSRICISLYSI
eukprot:TRINITY_DN2796_c0_g2_i7.p2 TRINITY_DN2796_c0_g2~~TRINITY_DN2796_c0_g2_i7.p2  ORF type:complete len:348 (-),score=114.55 TRINITY_DN2796_c0_g2_i7:2772-3815(-)